MWVDAPALNCTGCSTGWLRSYTCTWFLLQVFYPIKSQRWSWPPCIFGWARLQPRGEDVTSITPSLLGWKLTQTDIENGPKWRHLIKMSERISYKKNTSWYTRYLVPITCCVRGQFSGCLKLSIPTQRIYQVASYQIVQKLYGILLVYLNEMVRNIHLVAYVTLSLSTEGDTN